MSVNLFILRELLSRCVGRLHSFNYDPCEMMAINSRGILRSLDRTLHYSIE